MTSARTCNQAVEGQPRSAASAIDGKLSTEILEVLGREFLVPAELVTIVDPARRHVLIDGKRFRLNRLGPPPSPPDVTGTNRWALQLLDPTGRRTTGMSTARSPQRLLHVLRSPAPAPISQRWTRLRWTVAAIAAVACFCYLRAADGGVGTESLSGRDLLAATLIVSVPGLAVHPVTIGGLRRVFGRCRRALDDANTGVES